MGTISPVARTLEWLRDHDMKYDIASSYNTFSRRRKDLFGIIDIVAFKTVYNALNEDCNPPLVYKKVLVGIQVCGTDWQPHIKKITASPFALDWVEAGELWLFGWRKLKSGWKSRTYKFVRGDFKNVPLQPLNLVKTPDISAL